MIFLIPLFFIINYVVDYSSKVFSDKVDVKNDLVINEVLADNIGGMKDEEGNYADWIELYNPTSKNINLEEYAIGNKKNINKAFKLPSISVPANSYLVIFADNEDYIGQNIHLDFSLSKTGESVYLFDSEGNVIDQISYPKLESNISYGRSFSNMDMKGTLAYATPGSFNSSSFFIEREIKDIGTVLYSIEGGNYDEEFSLELSSTTPDAVILYTLNGSEPTPDNAEVYTKPIQITSTENVTNKYVTQRCIPDTEVNQDFHNYLYDYGVNNVYKGTVVRARLYLDGVLSDKVQTKTYFINAHYSLPVVSIATNPDALFGNEEGIYVLGSTYYAASKLNIADGTVGNYNIDKNIDGHIEIWDVNARNSVFESDIKLGLGGGFSRIYNQQKAFSIDIKEGEIEFPLFSTSKSEYSYNSFSLKSVGGGEAISNSYQKHFLNNMLLPLDIGTKIEDFCVLFVDGEYWGIYSIVEPKTEEYYEEHYGISDMEYYQNGLEGSSKNFEEELDNLAQAIEQSDFTDESQYAWLGSIVDIDNFIKFIASDIYIGNYDCVIDFDHNLLIWRSNTSNENNYYEDRRLRWTPIDMDSTLFADGCSKTVLDVIVNQETTKIKGNRITGILLKKLWERPEFRNEVAKEIYRLSNTVFSTKNIEVNFNKHYNSLESEMEENLKRLEITPNKYMEKALELLGNENKIITNLTYGEWKNNMQIMKSRLMYQEKVLETGLAEYTSLELEGEKKITVDNSFEYYALFSKGFSDAVIGEDGSYVWTVGEEAEFNFICKDEINGNENLCMKVNCATLQSEQKVNIFLNGEFLQQKVFTSGVNKIYIPANMLKSGYGNLKFEFVNAVSPKSLGIGEDETILALRIMGVSFEKASENYFKVNGPITLNITGDRETDVFSRGFTDPIIGENQAYIWTYGYESEMEFLIDKPLTICINAFPITNDQCTNVYINDEFIGKYSLVNNQIEIKIEEKNVSKGLVNIRMTYPDATSPKALGINDDEAILTFRIYSITFIE